MLIYERLSKYLVDLRKGRGTEGEDEIQLMKDLVKEFSTFSDVPREQSCHNSADTNGSPTKGEVVVSLYLALSNIF